MSCGTNGFRNPNQGFTHKPWEQGYLHCQMSENLTETVKQNGAWWLLIVDVDLLTTSFPGSLHHPKTYFLKLTQLVT